MALSTLAAADGPADDLPWRDLLWEDAATALSGTLVHAGRQVFAIRRKGSHAMRVYDARTGAVRWEAEARAVAVAGRRVFTAATTFAPGGAKDLAVRGYRAKTGALVWSDLFDTGGDDEPVAVVRKGRRIFVLGRAGLGPHWLVRAYARDGELLWSDRHPFRGDPSAYPPTSVPEEDPEAIAVSRDVVVATGAASLEDDQTRDFAVVAYHARTGALLWKDVVPHGVPYDAAPGPLAEADVVYGGAGRAAVAGGRVIVVGGVAFEAGFPSWVVRAYDAERGSLLWHDLVWFGGGSAQATREVVADGKHVFVTGELRPTRYDTHGALRAYDARTGEVLWERVERGFRAAALHLDAHGRLQALHEEDACACATLRLHDPATGAVLAEQLVSTDPGIAFWTLSRRRGRVAMLGVTDVSGTNRDVVVRALRARW